MFCDFILFSRETHIACLVLFTQYPQEYSKVVVIARSTVMTSSQAGGKRSDCKTSYLTAVLLKWPPRSIPAGNGICSAQDWKICGSCFERRGVKRHRYAPLRIRCWITRTERWGTFRSLVRRRTLSRWSRRWKNRPVSKNSSNIASKKRTSHQSLLWSRLQPKPVQKWQKYRALFTPVLKVDE